VNLGEMREAVRDDIDEDEESFWSDKLLNRYINRAVKHVRSKLNQVLADWTGREITATYPANTREVATSTLGLPDRPLNYILVTDGDGNTVEHVDAIDQDQFRRATGTVISAANLKFQAYFTSVGENGVHTFGLLPVPSGAATLRIKYLPQTQELEEDDDQPDFPNDFHPCVVLKATIYAKMREESPHADYVREFNETMQVAMTSLEGRGGDQHPRVHLTDYSMYQYD